jgi:hypothetical protein
MEDPAGKWQWGVETMLLAKEYTYGWGGEQSDFRVFTRDYRGVRILGSTVAREATEEQRQLAFSYDFSCVTRFGGCQQRCELAPLVWRAAIERSTNSHWALPVEETQDPRCKFEDQPQ